MGDGHHPVGKDAKGRAYRSSYPTTSSCHGRPRPKEIPPMLYVLILNHRCLSSLPGLLASSALVADFGKNKWLFVIKHGNAITHHRCK